MKAPETSPADVAAQRILGWIRSNPAATSAIASAVALLFLGVILYFVWPRAGKSSVVTRVSADGTVLTPGDAGTGTGMRTNSGTGSDAPQIDFSGTDNSASGGPNAAADDTPPGPGPVLPIPTVAELKAAGFQMQTLGGTPVPLSGGAPDGL